MGSTAFDRDYVTLHDVAIVDVHEAPGRQEPFDNLDEGLLKRLVEINNRRMADTGDEIPIVAHHTVKGAPHDEQPVIVGYAKDLYIAPFGELDPRPAIYARDWKILNEYVELARSRPRRSIEVWPDTLEIDPIALCGSDTPARHLGTLKFARKGEKVEILAPLQFAKEESMHMDTQDDGMVAKVIAALFETPMGKVLMEIVQERGFQQEGDEERAPVHSMVNAPPATSAQGFAAGMTPDTMPMPEHTPPKAEGFDHMSQHMPKHMPPTKPEEFNHEETPGPGGTHEPGRMPHKEKEEEHMNHYDKGGDPERFEKLRIEHDEAKLRYRKLEEQFGAEQELRKHLEDQVGAINLQLSRATFERKLTQLQGEGVQFNRREILDRVQHLTPEQFDKEVEYMKSNFKIAPIQLRYQEEKPFMREGGEELGAQKFSREEVKVKARDAGKQAQLLAKKDGISLTDAYDQIINQKN